MRSLAEKASAIHGASNESRMSDWVAALEKILVGLIKECEALE
jgi:hypothetical protein